jgi:hypothetical protein
MIAGSLRSSPWVRLPWALQRCKLDQRGMPPSRSSFSASYSDRSGHEARFTIWQLGLFAIFGYAVVLVSFIVQLLIHHVPAMQAMFGIALSASASVWRGSRWARSRSFS